MARALVLAAGGIVLRREDPARIAVVRLRKRNEWVLPKGKLDEGETPRAAAEREVLEETGHDVSVHEFLGTLVYEVSGRSKVVHYWRMEAAGNQAHELMHDIKAVDWLPLDDALARLSRSHERAFLENVGPLAVQAAQHARAARRSQAKQLVPMRRRSRPSEPSVPFSEQSPEPASIVAGVSAVESVELAAAVSSAIAPEMPSLLPAEPEALSSDRREVQSDIVPRDMRAGLGQRMKAWLRRMIGADRAAIND